MTLDSIPVFGPADQHEKSVAMALYGNALLSMPMSLRPDVERYVSILEKSLLAEWDYCNRLNARNVAPESVHALLLDPETAYVELVNCQSGTWVDLRAALQEMLNAGAVRFVLDLRDNAGGTTEESVLLASEFVGQGRILKTNDRDWDSTGNGLLSDLRYPLAVLINRWTCSSAEVIATAIAESGRGQLVGERTWGKAYTGIRHPDGTETYEGAWTTRTGRSVAPRGYPPTVRVEDFRDGKRDAILARALETF